MEQCIGADSSVWSGVLGLIVQYGAMYWDRYFSMKRCIGTDISVWSSVLGPIVQYGALYWD